MTDSQFSFNAVDGYINLLPLESITADPRPVLSIADPVVNAIATFYRQILNTNLLPRFANEAIACGLTHSVLDNWVDNTAVAQTIVFPLNEELLKATDFKFPLLAIQPVSEEYEQFSLNINVVKRVFKISYILPPLTAPQYNRMYEFLGLASKALLAYGPQGYDPKVSEVSVWQQSSIAYGSMNKAIHQAYKGFGKDNKTAFFPSIELEVSFTERNLSPVLANYPVPFTGVSPLDVSVISDQAPIEPVQVYTDGYVNLFASITSLSVNSGSIQGNTLLVIRGTGFYNIDSVLVCGVPVTKLTVRSPTIMTCLTGVAGVNLTSPIFGFVEIIDKFGNTYTSTDPNSYEYTIP